MSIFERSVSCSCFQGLYSHIDKNSGKKFEDMFLVEIANNGTSLIHILFSYFFYVFSAASCPSSCYRRLTFGDRMKKFKDDLICLEKTSIFQITVISSPQKLTLAGKYLETYDTRLILIIKFRYRNRLISSYPVAFCFNKESAFDSGKDLD